MFESGAADLEAGEIVQKTIAIETTTEGKDVAAMLSRATTQMEQEHKGQLASQKRPSRNNSKTSRNGRQSLNRKLRVGSDQSSSRLARSMPP